MRLILAAFLSLQILFFIAPGHCQNIDSLALSIKSSSQKIQQVNKEVNRWQDSSSPFQLRRYTLKNGKNLDLFLAEMKDRERKEKRRAYIRFGLGAAFLIMLILALVRKRKIRNTAD